MKKFTIMLSALLAFGSLQSFAQDDQADPQAEKPSTKSEFNGTNYYRLRNAETGRYLKVYGDVFKTEFTEHVAIFNTGSSINMVKKYSEVVSDPGTVLFVEDLGKTQNGSGIEVTNIEVKCQGTGLVENLDYSKMNESLKDFGIEGTEPQVSIRPTGETVNGKPTFFIETFQDFGPLAVKAVATARAAAAAGVPGAAERLAKLLEFAQKVAGHELDYRALAKVTGLKFIDLNNNKFTGAGDFTISYDYTDPANHIIFIGKDGVREDKDSKAAQWFIEPILADENVFGVHEGASVKNETQKELIGNHFYQTLFVDFPFEVDGINTKAYYGKTLNGNTLEMEEVGTLVPARTPVLIEFENPDAHLSQCTPVVDNTPAKEGNLLGGVIWLNHSLSCTSPSTISEEDKDKCGAFYDLNNIDKYVFGYSDKEEDKGRLGFYAYTGASQFGPWLRSNRAFLKLNGASVKGAIRISLGDKELTAINGVITESAPKAIYDLSGRRVENPTTGLYIVNGKKVLVK